jgi:hypothetical protein
VRELRNIVQRACGQQKERTAATLGQHGRLKEYQS